MVNSVELPSQKSIIEEEDNTYKNVIWGWLQRWLPFGFANEFTQNSKPQVFDVFANICETIRLSHIQTIVFGIVILHRSSTILIGTHR